MLVSDRSGELNAYALFNLQERSTLFIGSGVQVYEGMVVGENARPSDMDVNPTKDKKLTNIRTHSHDEALRLTPPPPLTLEKAIEFIAARRVGRGHPARPPPAQAQPERARPAARGRPAVRITPCRRVGQRLTCLFGRAGGWDIEFDRTRR